MHLLSTDIRRTTHIRMNCNVGTNTRYVVYVGPTCVGGVLS